MFTDQPTTWTAGSVIPKSDTVHQQDQAATRRVTCARKNTSGWLVGRRLLCAGLMLPRCEEKNGRTSFECVHPFTWPAVWQSLHQHWILHSWKVVSGAQTIFCSAHWENIGEGCVGYAATWDTSRVACGDLPMRAGAGWAGCNNLEVDGYQIYSNMKNMWTVLIYMILTSLRMWMAAPTAIRALELREKMLWPGGR